MAICLYFENIRNRAVKIYRHEFSAGSKTTYIRRMSYNHTGLESYSSYWDQVFKNGPSEIFGRQVLNNLK